MFINTDANMVEINPLILTKEAKIICLDAKVSFDSNALFRHPEILELRDLNEEDPTEIEASKHDLAYIKLDGSIGCMVNGAGLAMATMGLLSSSLLGSLFVFCGKVFKFSNSTKNFQEVNKFVNGDFFSSKDAFSSSIAFFLQ